MGVLLVVSIGGESPQLEATYESLDEILGFFFLFGGVIKLIGLLQDRPKWEACGSFLIGTAFLASLYSTVVTFPNPVSIIFLATLAIGHFHRSLALVYHKSDPDDV